MGVVLAQRCTGRKTHIPCSAGTETAARVTGQGLALVGLKEKASTLWRGSLTALLAQH